MLVYKLTTAQVWKHFGNALVRIGLGIGSGVYLLSTIWSGEFGFVASGALVFMAALSFLDVYQQGQQFTELYVFRVVRSCFIATPTALAIKAPGSPAVFLRKERCTGYKPEGHTYLTDDGREVSVIRPGVAPLVIFDREFLTPFFRLWWPEIPEDKAAYYFSKLFPEPTTLQYYILGGVVLGSLAITALFMWHTSAFGALLLYPILAQVVLRVYRLLPGSTLEENQDDMLPVPGQWMAHTEQLERERLERLGISNPEAFLWDNRPKLHVERLKEHQKWRRFQFALVATALAFIAMFATFWAFEHADEKWLDDNVPFVVWPAIGTLLIALMAWVPMMTGSIHNANIANSRTIAAKRRYGPIIYYKKRDCEGCTELGRTLVFRDGKSLTLTTMDVSNNEFFAMALQPYYSLWFPGTNLDDIKAAQTGGPRPKRYSSLSLLCSLLPFGIPLAMFLLGVHGVFVRVVALLLIPVAVCLYFYLNYGRKRRRVCPLPIARGPAEVPEAEYAED